MYLLIDLDRMCVVHRHEHVNALRNVAHIEMSHCASHILNEELAQLSTLFTLSELLSLYENLTGEKCPTNSTATVVGILKRLFLTIEPSQIDSFECALQANQIPATTKAFYRYVFGSNKPQELRDIFVLEPRKGSITQAHALPLVPPIPSPVLPVYGAPVPAAHAAPATPAAPAKYPPPWA